MKKLIAIIIVAVVILGGAYWLSGMMRGNTPSAPSPGVGQPSVVKGPFRVMGGPTGDYLADKGGITLYVKTKDLSNASGEVVVSCDKVCEQVWIPYLLGPGEAAPESSNDPLLSKINVYKRADGQHQFAIGNALLYYYPADKKVGDTKGTSIAGWSIARP